MKTLSKLVFAGEIPYLLGLAIGATCFYAGLQVRNEPAKFALVERGAVILEAVIDRQGESAETLKNEVTQPTLDVLKKYADLGYVVIDTSKDSAGNFAVAALPNETIDITAELRSAVKKQPKVQPVAASASKP